MLIILFFQSEGLETCDRVASTPNLLGPSGYSVYRHSQPHNLPREGKKAGGATAQTPEGNSWHVQRKGYILYVCRDIVMDMYYEHFV